MGDHGTPCPGIRGHAEVVALDGKDLLTREWLYTAITRATEQVVLVGSREALRSAVQRRTVRCTAFRHELAINSKDLE